MMNQSASLPASPLGATVVGNRWVDIDVPEIGEWTPTRTVTVVIPYFERPNELLLTLAALAEQSYPKNLLQVIVADDGSNVPPDVSEFDGMLDVVVRTQERQTYGVSRARNLGALGARGDVLVFLDCDMIPERHHIEAHARWHHSVSDAVVVGFRVHAVFSTVDVSQIAVATRDGSIGDLVSDQDVKQPDWIEHVMTRTHMLTLPRDNYFVVTSGGNLSMTNQMFINAGGFDESFQRWGGEDNELGFRLMQLGAVVVPERHAMCWHQGEGHAASPEEMESLRLQTPKMQNLIAELGYRKKQPGRSYVVPYAVVTIDAESHPAETTSLTVDTVLSSRFHDLVVHIVVPCDGFDTEWLKDSYASDGRVKFVTSTAESENEHRFSPLRLDVPPGVLFHRETMGHIVDAVRGPGVGILRLRVPSSSRVVVEVLAYSTRARNRARRVAQDPAEVEVVMGELFGTRTVSGRALGLGLVFQPDEGKSTIKARRPIGPLAIGASLKRGLLKPNGRVRRAVRKMKRIIKQVPG